MAIVVNEALLLLIGCQGNAVVTWSKLVNGRQVSLQLAKRCVDCVGAVRSI